MVRILLSKAEGAGSTPGQGTNIPHALGSKKPKTKQKQYYNKFSRL